MLKEFLLLLTGFIITLVSVLYIANIFVEYQCHSTWKLSKFNTFYSFSTGCLIEEEPSIWIPSKNYREM